MTTTVINNLTEEELEAALAEKRAAKAEEREKKRVQLEALKMDVIKAISDGALSLHKSMQAFKKDAFESMNSYYDLLQDYSDRARDGKGNFTIESDAYRIKFRNQTIKGFDERADQAEKHIIDFVNHQWQGDESTRELIMSLLERKAGALDIDNVQKLYKLEDRFDNENWIRGLQLLKESYTTTNTKSYIQIEEKDGNGGWNPIVLNFASI